MSDDRNLSKLYYNVHVLYLNIKYSVCYRHIGKTTLKSKETCIYFYRYGILYIVN